MIEVKNICMRYGKTVALDGVSFKAEKGKILGLVGPNGAGKTTLMRILTTFLYPAEGTALINGHDVTVDPLLVRGMIGYMTESVPLYDDMLVDEYLTFIGNARNFFDSKIRERLAWVRENCGLLPIWKHSISEISKGYRQRVGLAQALIHDPQVLILDEPMTGLDPLQIISIRKLIRTLAKDKTVIFSTHIFQEVEALADRIVILNDSRLIADGTHKDITDMATKGERITLVVKAGEEDVKGALEAEDIVDDYRLAGIEGGGYSKFIISAEEGKPLSVRMNEIIEEKKWLIKEMRQEKATLEEAFIWLLSKDKKKKRTAA
ncbi:MAG: ATP-binding cassette domain-containing protein [Candidatus Omnitrophica bacterium]|nr:ATP-binding cassette domain-containing protein [Candidatus Omnitrophota bacterium]